MKLIGKAFLYIVNLPKSQAGRLAELYYTIHNADGSVHTARTQTGLVEFGLGKYGVELSFSTEGGYIITFDIDASTYTAAEAINIYDDAVRYDGYGL